MKKLHLLLAAAMFGIVLTLTGCGRSDSELSADACPLVEEIIYDNLQVHAKCTRLLDIQKIDNDHYTAIAEVTCDGETELLDITITYSDDMVIVMIN